MRIIKIGVALSCIIFYLNKQLTINTLFFTTHQQSIIVQCILYFAETGLKPDLLIEQQFHIDKYEKVLLFISLSDQANICHYCDLFSDLTYRKLLVNGFFSSDIIQTRSRKIRQVGFFHENNCDQCLRSAVDAIYM